ncbi:hypothetical protein F2P81_019586 [Scophthalmus maximus]|uniref:Uncharacterized protein n=1 Tax=Scophthalmus maximus TaxID=52904 RepID=A0A6A4S7I2_SCOMX|nr:hypothetical protein F2P81_019586 [Scophthalmus maximus]
MKPATVKRRLPAGPLNCKCFHTTPAEEAANSATCVLTPRYTTINDKRWSEYGIIPNVPQKNFTFKCLLMSNETHRPPGLSSENNLISAYYRILMSRANEI